MHQFKVGQKVNVTFTVILSWQHKHKQGKLWVRPGSNSETPKQEPNYQGGGYCYKTKTNNALFVGLFKYGPRAKEGQRLVLPGEVVEIKADLIEVRFVDHHGQEAFYWCEPGFIKPAL